MLLPQYLSHIQYCSWDTLGWAILDWGEGASAGTLGWGAAGPGGVQRAEWWALVSLTLWNNGTVFGQCAHTPQPGDNYLHLLQSCLIPEWKREVQQGCRKSLASKVSCLIPKRPTRPPSALAQGLTRACIGLPQATGWLLPSTRNSQDCTLRNRQALFQSSIVALNEVPSFTFFCFSTAFADGSKPGWKYWESQPKQSWRWLRW